MWLLYKQLTYLCLFFYFMSNFTALSLIQMKSQGNMELLVCLSFDTYMIRTNERRVCQKHTRLLSLSRGRTRYFAFNLYLYHSSFPLYRCMRPLLDLYWEKIFTGPFSYWITRKKQWIILIWNHTYQDLEHKKVCRWLINIIHEKNQLRKEAKQSMLEASKHEKEICESIRVLQILKTVGY